MLQGKYPNRSAFELVRARRAVVRFLLRDLVRWNMVSQPDPGYTVVIGASHRLLALAAANLALLSRQDRTGLREVLLVIDAPAPADVPANVRAILERHSQLPLRVLWYTPRQHRRARLVRWAWAYSWMSWAIGIGVARTRYALLHDLDAMLIRPDILRCRYETIVERGDEYLGTRFYSGMGVLASDCLATTYELMFDAEFVRRTFRPLDLFSHVALLGGRSIDYDTFLWAQHQAGKASILPIDEDDMVHPSQMICQFTELVDRGRQPHRAPNLPLLPYLCELGGDPRWFQEQTRLLAQGSSRRVPFLNRELDLSGLTTDHVAWLRKQAYRLEQAVHGGVRETVSAYFDALRRHADAARAPDATAECSTV